jgi:hypothetical protein
MPFDFESALRIAQTLIQDESKGGPVREGLIQEAVAQALNIRPRWKETVDQTKLIRVLETHFNVWVESATSLVGEEDQGRWLTAEQKNEWQYWPRYRMWLEPELGTPMLDSIDEDTDRIVELIGNPKRAGKWDRRGLVVGDVQSGKTSNLIGVINKAADLGFKLIIVLSGQTENLRVQTQIRLDEGFLGFETGPLARAKGAALRTIGVGEENKDPSVRPDFLTHRGENGDFRKQDAIRFGVSPGTRPLLFVVKKNVSILTNLLGWIGDYVSNAKEAGIQWNSKEGDTQRDVVNDIPILVIDDEADQASVDTGVQSFDADGQPDPNYDPKTINRLIRSLLRTFNQSAYVGYTATPFANIFIHEQGETAKHGIDLFPKNFIINIESPSNYAGPARIFGLPSNESWEGVPRLPLVRHVKDHAKSLKLDEQHGWMPPKHRKDLKPLFNGQEDLPESLKAAILSFLLVISCRRMRGQVKKHNSMLIHVTRFQDVQQHVSGQVKEYLLHVKRRLKLKTGDRDLQLAIHSLWEEDFVPTIGEVGAVLGTMEETPSWDEILAELPLVAEAIRVLEINGKARETLEYQIHKENGLNVIAIGGDKLARGLTLDGLSVSYFLRASKMYDTLMQMGRWFGYRPGYLDLTRLYTTPDLEEWFQHIVEANAELRAEFNHMSVINGTPRDYGLKIKSHPLLMVTSSVKMRNSLELRLSFSGSLSEMVVFHRDPDKLKANLRSTEVFLNRLGKTTATGVTRPRPGSTQHQWKKILYWEKVPADQVIAFLRAFQVHRSAYSFNTLLMADYIEKMANGSGLTSWTVAVMGGDGGTHRLAGHDVRLVERSPNERSLTIDQQKKDGRILIRRLLAPRDESVDLSEKQYADALAQTISEYEANKARTRRKSTPTEPAGFFLRRNRHKDHGLLLIYPLSPAAGKLETNDPIIGLGVSFAGSGNPELDQPVVYKVNNIYYEQELGGGG